MNVVFYWFYFLVILKMKNESFLDVVCIHMVSLICLHGFVSFLCWLFEERSNSHFFYIQISDFFISRIHFTPIKSMINVASSPEISANCFVSLVLKKWDKYLNKRVSSLKFVR